MQLTLGYVLFMTFLGWLTLRSIDVSADTTMLLSLPILVGVPAISVMHYRHYIPVFSTREPLFHLIPLPHIWSLLACLLASLPAGAVVAACYFTLFLAFRNQPGIYLFDGWQWLMLIGIYILAQLTFVCQLAIGGALRDRLVWPNKLRFLRKLAWWSADTATAMYSMFVVVIVISPLYYMTFTDYIAISRVLLALFVYAASAVLLYSTSSLLEKYSNY